MSRFRTLAITIAACLGGATQVSLAQVSLHIGVPGVSVNVGAPPACPYGYYDYSPYNCAPYGYYGSEWFAGGVFVGAGPWFHGPAGFHGAVNSHYDPRRGYHGAMPRRGERPDPHRPVGHVTHFHGDESHDGHGHVQRH
jgi:hypothetical protein